MLILVFSYSLAFCAQSQIVIGTYSTMYTAVKIKKEVNHLVDDNKKLNYMFKQNSLSVKAKKRGKYFIVTIEPINNMVILSHMLKKIKKIQFKDAFALKL